MAFGLSWDTCNDSVNISGRKIIVISNFDQLGLFWSSEKITISAVGWYWGDWQDNSSLGRREFHSLPAQSDLIFLDFSPQRARYKISVLLSPSNLHPGGASWNILWKCANLAPHNAHALCWELPSFSRQYSWCFNGNLTRIKAYRQERRIFMSL